MTTVCLTPEQVAFITRDVSLSIASRDVRRVPSVCKAVGCRVAPDRRRVTLLVEAAANAQLLADLRATAAVAAVFSLPATHETLQLKGRDACVQAADAEDIALARAHNEAFAQHLVPLGYPLAFARAVHDFRDDDLVAVSFTVSDIFAQTPGPGAGARMGNA